MTENITEILACNLEVTANARKGMANWTEDAQRFFAMQEAFHVHIEKRPNNRHGNVSYSIFFDNETNEPLAERLNDRVAVMECVAQHDGFLATGFHVRGKREPVRTNRRLSVRLKFHLNRGSGATMPVELYTRLRELPVADERSEYVEKRIASWEGYLRIQEKNADVEDMTATFTSATINEDFSKLRLVCSGLKSKDWRTIIGFSAKLEGIGQDIGNVVHANRTKQLVEIELSPKYKSLARRNEWHPKNRSEVTFSNFAELSQVRRLRKGFKDLQDGLAANANLEKILFEERPVVRISKSDETFEFHNRLNEFQQEAVIGAMTSNDLYVIQGPPGTGKTTVISEICHQNVKKGLRTLVASQANLAVDNALGRLISQQEIRILRRGRTDSIEEEGKRFIEENVALHWKEETLEAVRRQVADYPERKEEIDNELKHSEQKIRQLQDELVLLDKQIELKKAAQAEHETLSQKLGAHRREIVEVEKELARLAQREVDGTEKQAELSEDMIRLREELRTLAISPELSAEMEDVPLEIERCRMQLSYLKVKADIEERVNALAELHEAKEGKQQQLAARRTLLQDVQSVKKFDVLQVRIQEEGVSPPPSTVEKMQQLDRLRTDMRSTAQSGDFADWKEVHARLTTAIGTVEKTLAQNGFLNHSVKRNRRPDDNTAQAIHALIDRIARFIIAPSTKQLLATRNYSAQKYDLLEKIAIALDLLVDRRNFVEAQSANMRKFEQLIATSKELFGSVKVEMTDYIDGLVLETEKAFETLQQEVERYQMVLQDLRTKSAEISESLGSIDETETEDMIRERMERLEKSLAEYDARKMGLERHATELKVKEAEATQNAQQLEENAEALHSSNEKLGMLRETTIELQKGLESLAEQLAASPEEKRDELQASLAIESQNKDDLEITRQRLPMTHALQQQWVSLLTEANDYDLDEIRKLYVQHANVIGTTCVASASRDFMEQYPTFDVVIIDEVSKATPPELLLPMLKGKKIILVGDHHQLPPLMGHETLEELLEESDDPAEKRELEKLLKESLFERLFRTLPKQNKTMLGIQYRMHESIMESITPFYDEGDYTLQCGLTDSDTMRDHLIDSKYVKRDDHLLWFDMPNEPDYFEQKVKGGTSRYNEAELSMIRDLMMDLDTSVAQAKQSGTMEREALKSVGVISFYGEQVKRIDRLIEQQLNPKHLHCRTGSVDKFQGMEMDVIILSFVRNHGDKGGDIGFARDYRRLNVALSRARELLIIVGSADMFKERTKDRRAREMYQRLVDQIKSKSGFKALITNKA